MGSHLFFCLGVIVLGGKENRTCMHGRPIASWQIPVSFPAFRRFLLGMIILAVFVGGAIAAILSSQ